MTLKTPTRMSRPGGLLLVALAAGPGARAQTAPPAAAGKPVTVGAYYFDGWAGRHRSADDPKEPWAKNAPTHLSRRMVEEFAGREPVWGWRDDTPEIVERQIDLAADHGISFFAFCWYWQDNAKAINPEAIRKDPKHTGLELYLKARNRDRLRFCLLVANHAGHEIRGADAWRQAAEFWMPYLTHPRHVRVGGRPLLLIFDPKGADREGLAALQSAARRAGLPGIAVAACGNGSPADGFTHRTRYNIVPGYAAGPAEHTYAELVEAHRKAWAGTREQPCLPEVTAGWDKRPWEGPAGLGQKEGWYYPDRTPAQFAGFLKDAVAWMDAHPEATTAERILLIYAWNEFGEGGYIAPTKEDSEGAYLKALQGATKR